MSIMEISLCGSADLPTISEIINESALAYKEVIPADRWHEPYMHMANSFPKSAKAFNFTVMAQATAW